MPNPTLLQPYRDAPPAQERARAARWLRHRLALTRRRDAAVGAVLALVIVTLRAASLSEPPLRLDRGSFLAFAALLVAAGGAAPWAVPRPLLRRLYRRRLRAAVAE